MITHAQFTAIAAATTVHDFAYAVRKASCIFHPEDRFEDLIDLETKKPVLTAGEADQLNAALHTLWKGDEDDRFWPDWERGTAQADAEARTTGAVGTIELVPFDQWKEQFKRFGSREEFVAAKDFHGLDETPWDNETIGEDSCVERNRLAALWAHPDGAYYCESNSGRVYVILIRTEIEGHDLCRAGLAEWLRGILERKVITGAPRMEIV